MNEVSDAVQIARASARAALEGEAWSVTLLTDGEAFANTVAPQAGYLRDYLLTGAATGQVVLESLLPEIRALAMLLASRRQRGAKGCMPARLADAADWLAARIAVLRLSHVVVTTTTLPCLDEANQRLKALSEETGHALPPASPVLMTGLLAPSGEQPLLQAWSLHPSLAPGRATDMAGCLSASRQLREHCRRHLGGRLVGLGLH